VQAAVIIRANENGRHFYNQNNTMGKLNRTLTTVATLLALGAPLTARANVIPAAPVGGYNTFEDQNTGYVWLDLNDFFGESYNQMASTATGLGFNLATEADVSTLLNSLPLTGGRWTSYAATMGSAPNRELIWGAFYSDATSVGWAYAYSYQASWTIYGFADWATDIPNAGTPNADLNIWAYKKAGVPDGGSTIAMLGMVVSGLAFIRRKL
jgi:hypothetical protein